MAYKRTRVPKHVTQIEAAYRLNGSTHTIIGRPGDVADQLHLLLDIYPGLKYIGWR